MKLPRAAVICLLAALATLALRPFDAADPQGLLNSAVTLALLAGALVIVLAARRR